MARAVDIEIYLELQAGAGAATRLAAALSACRPAAVLVGGKLDAAEAKGLIEAAQKAGAAAIVADDDRLARTLRADGLHISASADIEERYAQARDLLGRQCIVGADAGTSRHDAMSLGEAGAEYVAFGGTLSPEERLDMTAWWADIFEVPCVALGVSTSAEAGMLAAAGADFIGIPVLAGQSADDVVQTVRAYVKAIRAAEPDRTERTP